MENIDYLIEYDRSDPISIETYSQKLIGKTFRQIWEEDDARQPMMVREDSTPYGSSEVAVRQNEIRVILTWTDNRRKVFSL